MDEKKCCVNADNDVVVSTRVRLARNLRGEPFPARLNTEGKKRVNAAVRSALESAQLQYLEMEAMNDIQAVSLAERHLISPEFASQREGRAVLLSKDEAVSIMLNEEDHIRIQAISPGLALTQAYDVANAIDDMLGGKLDLAYHPELGYLTQCPTNLGTGMRASVMLHLPALQELGQIKSLANTVSKLGLTIRGTYGEGSQASGAFYQLSNQVTLGISEEAALANLEGITRQVILQERRAREGMIKKPAFLDKIWRAAGILSFARRLSSDEFMKMLSLVRLGAAQGIFKISQAELSKLVSEVQPATLMAMANENLDAQQRDVRRAAVVREKLKNISSD